jgi:ABC-type multidrug transport system fused ATPase/permease subunit
VKSTRRDGDTLASKIIIATGNASTSRHFEIPRLSVEAGDGGATIGSKCGFERHGLCFMLLALALLTFDRMTESPTFAEITGTIAAMARQLLKTGMHVLAHVATAIVGVVLLVVGLGLTMSVVFVGAGVLSLSIGVALIVGAIFAHQMAGP